MKKDVIVSFFCLLLILGAELFNPTCYAKSDNSNAIALYDVAESGDSDDVLDPGLYYTGIDDVYVKFVFIEREGFHILAIAFVNKGITPFVLENVYPRDVFVGGYRASSCNSDFVDGECYRFKGEFNSELDSYSHFELRYYDHDNKLKKKRIRPWGNFMLLDPKGLTYDFSKEHSIRIKNISTDDILVKGVVFCDGDANDDKKFNMDAYELCMIDKDLWESDETIVVKVPARKNSDFLRTLLIIYSDDNGASEKVTGFYLKHKSLHDD